MDAAHRRQYEKQKAERAAIKKFAEQHPEEYERLRRQAMAQLAEKQRLQAEEARRRQEAAKQYRLEIEAAKALEYRSQHTLLSMQIPDLNLKPVYADLPPMITDGTPDEPILAFRDWNYKHGWLHGTGMGSSYAWQDVNFSDDPPTNYNSHGLYALHLTPLSILSQTGAHFGDFCGIVVLRGDVIEHEDGILRAEYARIACIFVKHNDPKIYAQLPELYKNYPTTPICVTTPETVAKVLFALVLGQ